MTTKSQTTASDVQALIKARNGVLWIDGREEQRIEGWLFKAAEGAGYMPFLWDCVQGAIDVAGNPVPGMAGQPGPFDQPGAIVPADASTILRLIDQRSRQGQAELWILRDLHKWVEGPGGNQILRALRNLTRSLPPTGTSIVVLTPGAKVPADIGDDVVAIDWPLPDREELQRIAETAVAVATRNNPGKIEQLNGNTAAVIDAAVGLSAPQAESCFAKSIVQRRKIDPEVVSEEKKRLIASNGMLQWIDVPEGGLDMVGGLDVMKTWLIQRELANTPEAQAYGLSTPKGCLVVGPAGCGKSLSAMATASAWKRPLIKGDLGATGSKFLGESEQNIRQMLNTATALGPIVLWFDEIDKTLSGGAGPAGDGGVAADKLAVLLTWMNDRKNPAFIFATANNPDRLPVELLRKGRWDEIWFIDCPNARERVDVLNVTLRKFKREPFDAQATAAIVRATDRFTGAEIANLVPESLFVSYADGKRPLTAKDILNAAGKVVPMVDSMAEQVAAQRAWSKRARLATTPDAPRAVSTERALSVS